MLGRVLGAGSPLVTGMTCGWCGPIPLPQPARHASATAHHVTRIAISFSWGRLLNAGGVDVTMSSNAICTPRIILDAIVFQEPYKRVAPSRHPCEHKTLASNMSLSAFSW
jgi:hypothetical protein